MPEKIRTLTLRLEQEDDGRWIGEVADLPGCMMYGNTDTEAAVKAVVLALKVLSGPPACEHPLSPEEAAAQARLSELFGRVDFAPGFDTDRGRWPVPLPEEERLGVIATHELADVPGMVDSILEASAEPVAALGRRKALDW